MRVTMVETLTPRIHYKSGKVVDVNDTMFDEMPSGKILGWLP